MGYLKTISIDELQLPSNPDFTVRMRARASYGLIKDAQSAMMQVSGEIDPQTGQAITKTEWGAYVSTLLLGLLVDWNLTDEAEQPLPLNKANLDRLDPQDGQFLADAATKRASLRGGVAEAGFGTPSS